RLDVSDHDVRASVRERQGDGAPNAAAAAGDDGGLASKGGVGGRHGLSRPFLSLARRWPRALIMFSHARGGGGKAESRIWVVSFAPAKSSPRAGFFRNFPKLALYAPCGSPYTRTLLGSGD